MGELEFNVRMRSFGLVSYFSNWEHIDDYATNTVEVDSMRELCMLLARSILVKWERAKYAVTDMYSTWLLYVTILEIHAKHRELFNEIHYRVAHGIMIEVFYIYSWMTTKQWEFVFGVGTSWLTAMSHGITKDGVRVLGKIITYTRPCADKHYYMTGLVDGDGEIIMDRVAGLVDTAGNEYSGSRRPTE